MANMPQLKSLFPAMYDTVAGRILAVRGLEFNEIIAAKI